jgi:hypothetical protein
MQKYLAALICLTCLVGCGPDTAAREEPGFEIAAPFSGYRFTVWLNGEPIVSSYANGGKVIYGFPMQKGSNQVSVSMEILPPPAKPPISLKLVMNLKDKPTSDAKWKQIEDYDESGPFSNSPYMFDSGFDLESSVKQTSKDFNSIGDDKEGLSRRVRQLTAEIGAKLRDGKAEEWSRILGPGGGKAYLARQWFSNGKDFKLKPVSDISEMVVEFGKCLILVHAKQGVLIGLKVGGEDREGGYTDFVFARRGAKWCISGPDGHWWTLPDDLQNF